MNVKIKIFWISVLFSVLAPDQREVIPAALSLAPPDKYKIKLPHSHQEFQKHKKLQKFKLKNNIAFLLPAPYNQ